MFSLVNLESFDSEKSESLTHAQHAKYPDTVWKTKNKPNPATLPP